jgi:hypothetical protein
MALKANVVTTAVAVIGVTPNRYCPATQSER